MARERLVRRRVSVDSPASLPELRTLWRVVAKHQDYNPPQRHWFDIEPYDAPAYAMLQRRLGEIELALDGHTPPPEDSPDAWGPLAMRAHRLVAPQPCEPAPECDPFALSRWRRERAGE